MDEKKEESKKEVCCSEHGFCYCKALFAVLIIVFTWVWVPSWANIAITILAVLIILGAGGCCCRKMCKTKK